MAELKFIDQNYILSQSPSHFQLQMSLETP